MENQKALQVLKQFYNNCESIERISQRVGLSKDETRQILRNARECGLISYSTKEYREVFVNIKKAKLGNYLRTKGLIK